MGSAKPGSNPKVGLKAIIGRKVQMSQLFDDEGNVVPVTIVEAGPCRVLQVKTDETKDGYRALQIGFGYQKSQRLTKPVLGHFKNAGVEAMRVIREVDYPEGETRKPGDTLTCAMFAVGEYVDVIGISKGKGFQGTIKRHNFISGPKTHGSKNYREPGSTGMHTYPARVIKGKRMPGHMGDERVTIQNLKVARVDASNNLLYIEGAIPGANGGHVVVRRAKKKGGVK